MQFVGSLTLSKEQCQYIFWIFYIKKDIILYFLVAKLHLLCPHLPHAAWLLCVFHPISLTLAPEFDAVKTIEMRDDTVSPRKQTRPKRPPIPSRRKRRVQPPSRIPGVFVGEEVSTAEGTLKKVCFNTGGGWAFRMVRPEWRAPGRPKKGRGRRSGRRKDGETKRRGAKDRTERPDDSDD